MHQDSKKVRQDKTLRRDTDARNKKRRASRVRYFCAA